LRCEGFVRFNHIHLIQFQAGFFKGGLSGGDRALSHDVAGHAGHGIRHQTGHGLMTTLSGHSSFCQDKKRSAIINAGGIACGDGTIFLESRFHGGQLF